jgi:hypothetical protein
MATTGQTEMADGGHDIGRMKMSVRCSGCAGGAPKRIGPGSPRGKHHPRRRHPISDKAVNPLAPERLTRLARLGLATGRPGQLAAGNLSSWRREGSFGAIASAVAERSRQRDADRNQDSDA